MNITAEEAKQIMDTEEGYVILDVRTQEEYDQGHIPGAVVISHEEIAEKAEKTLTDKDQLILVYCRSGRRSKIAASRKLVIGEFSMNMDERTAKLGAAEIPLTAREFNLLYKLLSYPGKTFTRSQLMDEFWDSGTTSGPRTVDVYMAKLRERLSECQDFEIVTVHGLGYKAVLK